MKKALFLVVLLVIGYMHLNGQSWISSNKISCTESFIELSSKINSLGEIISYGYFSGTLSSSGGISVSSNGGTDYYLIKFHLDGTVDWMRNFGSVSPDYNSGGVSIESDGNILITGGFVGSLEYLPGQTLVSTGLYDIFLIQLNSSGDVNWGRNIGQGASYQMPTTLETNSAGNIIIAGLFIDSINVNNDISLYADNSYAQYFYGAFDASNGDVIWLKQIRSLNNHNSKINDIYCNTNSYFYTGVFSDSVGFENDTIVATNNKNDVHLFSTDNTGLISWIRKIKGSGDEFSYAVLTDDEGYVYVSGYYNSDTLFVDSDESSVVEVIGNDGAFDLFVARYSSSGDLEWFKTAGSNYEDKCFKMEFFDDKVWITGYFADTLNWGGLELVSEGPGDIDMFTGSLDKDGNYRDANRYGGRNNSNDQGRGLFKSGDNLYTLMRTNSDQIVIGDSIYTSDGVSYYMVLGVIGCLPISVDNTIPTNITGCYGDSTGSIQVVASGGFGTPWQYSIDNGDSYSTGAYYADLPAGDYQVVVIDAQGCTEVGPLITLTQPDSLEAILESSLDIKYHIAWNGPIETEDGSLVVSATGGTDPYTFQLLPSGAPQAVGTYYFPYPDSGKYVVAVQDLNNCGPVNTDTVVISVERSDATGIGDQDGVEMKVYPNPTSGIVTIEMPFEGRKCRLEVVNMTGQTVLKSKVYSNGGVITETLDLSDQAKGLYMIRINGEALQSAIMVK